MQEGMTEEYASCNISMAFVKVLRFRLSGRNIHIAMKLRSGGSGGLGWLVEQSLVLLLGLDESLLEKVGVYDTC